MMLQTELSEVIDNAIVNEEIVRFWYLPGESLSPPQWRTLSPYEASEDGETILGYDHDREELRRFRFDRIIDIETILDEDYIRPIEKEDR